MLAHANNNNLFLSVRSHWRLSYALTNSLLFQNARNIENRRQDGVGVLDGELSKIVRQILSMPSKNQF